MQVIIRLECTKSKSQRQHVSSARNQKWSLVIYYLLNIWYMCYSYFDVNDGHVHEDEREKKSIRNSVKDPKGLWKESVSQSKSEIK